MKPTRTLPKLATTVVAATSTLLVLLFAIPANPAAGRTAIASTSRLGCPRPLISPRSQPESLKGWYSRQNKYLTNRIGLDQRALAREGLQLTQWGPNPCSGKVKVYLTHYSRAAAQILIAKYGNGVVVSHRSMPRPPIDTRSGDISPFNGGDFIITDVGECSGGPIVEGNTNNEAYMLTAGHCTRSLNQTVTASNRNGDLHGPIGVTNVRRLCNNCIDTAQIRHDSTGARYNYKVWGGGDNSGAAYDENGTCFPQPFNLVTQDSAFTGEIRGLVVEDVNQTVTFSDGITRVELTLVHGGLTIIHSGDSGGPWVQHQGSTNNVCITGTTVGGGGEFAYYQQIGGIDKFLNTRVP